MFNRFSILAALCLSLGTPLAAQTPTGDAMTPQQFFDVGATFLRAGQPQDAARIADSLLARKADDVSALILRTEAAIALRDYAAAVQFGRTAYNNATNNRKFAAARLVALAHAQSKNDTLAQLWLRRARQFAPDAQTAQGIAKDYQFLRKRNPWSTQLRFGITPSTNINNGSANTTTQLFGLPFEFQLDGEARALSGLQISGGFDTRYRLSQSRNAITFLTLSADMRTYVMSSAAKEQAPDAKGSDFGDASLRFGINHKRILSEGAMPTDFHLLFGQTWFNGDDMKNIIADSQFAQTGFSQSWAIGENDLISAGLTLRKDIYTDGDPAAQTVGISTRWAHKFDNKDRFAFGLQAANKTSDDPEKDYTSVSYTTNYDIAKPIYGMRFGFGANYATRDYDASTYAPGPREDRTYGLTMSVEMTKVEFYGFRPVINMEVSRNESSINLFDRDYSNLGFDLRSSF